MKVLKEIDLKDYNPHGTIGKRPSVRAIIIRDDKVALVYSRKFNYYKFPGGGIEEGESKEDALIREVLEETGLNVIPESIKEYGQIIRKEKGLIDDIFIQENFYYKASVKDEISEQKLDDYEEDEGFTLEWVNPDKAIQINDSGNHGVKADNRNFNTMIVREKFVLQKIAEEK